MSLQNGQTFSHYRIRSHIAEGGTGDVYRVLDTQSGRDVALKIPSKETIVDPSKYEAYLREVEALQLLSSPAVQHMIEVSRFDSTPYLVTELIEGKSLRKLIKERGSFPLDQAIPMTRQIAEGLAYCHAQGVIHRDVKPENILITDEGQPVIIDFGLALTPTRSSGGKAAGTPDYVAPEQIEGQRGDARTDVYALGAVFCELLTGAPPFAGVDPQAVMNMHLYSAVPRLDQIKPEITPQIAYVVARCLQRIPANRYADMPALINDLDQPDQIDVSALDNLCAVPPRPPFYKNQTVQAVLFSFVLLIGIMLLSVLLTSLKR